MTIDQKITDEIARHKKKVQELKDLLEVYNQDNSYIDRNVNQAVAAGIDADTIVAYEESRRNVNPYAEQIASLKAELDAERELHEKNMQELEAERAELTGKKEAPAHITKDYIASAVDEIRKNGEIALIKSKGLYYDSFSKIAYVNIVTKGGVLIQTTISKKEYDKLSEYFEHYPDDIDVSEFKKEEEKEEEKVEALEDDKLSKEEIINRLLEKMFPEGADYAMLPDIKRQLEKKTIEELQKALEEYNEMANQNLDETKTLEENLDPEAEKKARDDLMNEIISAMYPGGIEYVPVADIKKRLDKNTTADLKAMLESLQPAVNKEQVLN